MADTSLAHSAPDSTDERAAHFAALKQRCTKGMLLFNGERDRIHRLFGDTFAVPSSQGGFYRVNIGDPQTCGCSDFRYRCCDPDTGEPVLACKHIVAACLSVAARRSGVKVRSITVAGDPFKAAGSRRLCGLRDRYRNELMDDEERQEVRDRLLRLRG